MTTALHRQIALAFLALAAVIFIVRGPMRTLRSGDDLAPPYGGARAWLLGENPYDSHVLAATLLEAGRESDADGKPRGFNPSLYPPPTFVALLPLAALSWPVARGCFLALSILLVAAHLQALLRLVGVSVGEVPGLVLVGSVSALAPYHTGIALGQLAIPSVALLVIAIERIENRSDLAGGLLLGAATLLKPQLAGLFILYFLWRRHWRAALVAAGVGAVASVLALGWLWWNDIDWVASWQATAAMTRTVGGPLDPSGPLSAQLIDLQPLLALFSLDSPGVIALLIGAVLAIAIYRLGDVLGPEHNLLLLSAVATLSLLIVYHRFYDAAVLSLPLSWAVTTWRCPKMRRFGVGVALCCAVFFVPGAWMLQVFAERGSLPSLMTQSAVWNAVLLRHQNWALVVLIGLLLRAAHRVRVLPPLTTS